MVCCVLFVVRCCVLCVVCCVLCVKCCSLFGVGCLVVTCCLLFVVGACNVQLVMCSMLLVVVPDVVARRVLFVVRCLLFGVCCL